MNAVTPGAPPLPSSSLPASSLPASSLPTSASHYAPAGRAEGVERRVLCVVVDNEPGVLARIAGLFSGRGYNIESLTVSETEHEAHVSRITVVTSGTAHVLAQIKAHLERLVPVHRVADLTLEGLAGGGAIERELALVKVSAAGEPRVEALRLAGALGARVVDATLASFVFEVTGDSGDVDRFVALMARLGAVEVARTGVAAIARGGPAPAP